MLLLFVFAETVVAGLATMPVPVTTSPILTLENPFPVVVTIALELEVVQLATVKLGGSIDPEVMGIKKLSSVALSVSTIFAVLTDNKVF